MVKSQRGFALVETLVALSILMTIGIIVLTSLIISAKSILISDTLNKAESLARAELEYIQSQPYSTSNNYLILDIPSYYSGFSYITPMATPIDSGLQKITVTVRNGNSAFTLVDYRANR